MKQFIKIAVEMAFVVTVSRQLGRQLLPALKSKCVRPALSRFISRTTLLHSDRLYTDKHEWITVDGKIGTVGASSYAQDTLGEIVYAQLPDVDTELEQFGECGALESVKAVSEVYSPVSGRVTEKNTAVEDTPALVNRSCYDEGWLYKLEVKNMDELKALMDEKAYEIYIQQDSDDEYQPI